MDALSWNVLIAELPAPHLLQTYQWGQVKSQFGWQPSYKVWREGEQVVAAALTLQRSLRLSPVGPKLNMFYVPKGPLLADWSDADLRGRVLDDLSDLARQQGAFFLKIDPDVPQGRGVSGEEGAEEYPVGEAVLADLRARGWRFSHEQVQFRNTVLIDLTPSEDELLAAMKQKTRYNVRLAGRKGVTVRIGGPDDFDLLYQMYAETAIRDGFAIRAEEYYRTVWQVFHQGGMLKPLIAEVQGQAVAALMLFLFGERAWYIYGMSSDLHREKMPNYLLQWEAMRTAKAAGCRVYDLWGAPDEFDESDPLWGVYRFKNGLGGEVWRHLGAWDLPLRPWVYRFYTQAWPALMGALRWVGRARTRQSLEGGM